MKGTKELTLGIGDFNGHVGKNMDRFESVHGENGIGKEYLGGRMLLDFCNQKDLCVANTWFKKKEERKVTYSSTGNETKKCFPALANIFVGYQVVKLFNISRKPSVYFRYIDDTFAVFNNKEDCNTFLIHLNSLYPSLCFTNEKESTHSLPFLDVLVERHDLEFLTLVYRKPTFTSQYLCWNSFSPQKWKINLIGTLVYRAFMICSKSKLDPELGKIHSILLENGYLEHAINSTFKQKLKQLNSNLVHKVEKCPVYLHIPWIGNVSKFEKQIISAVKCCFFFC